MTIDPKALEAARNRLAGSLYASDETLLSRELLRLHDEQEAAGILAEKAAINKRWSMAERSYAAEKREVAMLWHAIQQRCPHPPSARERPIAEVDPYCSICGKVNP